ncbi:MAG: S8 family serine peptidase [bacterium]
MTIIERDSMQGKTHRTLWKGFAFTLLIVFFTLLFSPGSYSQTPAPKKLLPGHGHSKISATLVQVADRLVSLKKAGPAARQAPSSLSNAAVKVDDAANIQTYIYLSETSGNALQTLKGTGVTIELVQEEWNVVQAWIPAEKIHHISAYAFVLFIRPPDYAIHMTGSVNTEGDTLLRAQDIRLEKGIDGTGARVGVISDGVDNRALAQAQGDLPSAIEVNPNLPGEGDEGTAMLEIVHDLAPGAELAFSGATTGMEMIDAIRFLANEAFAGQGCDVIVDDLGFLGQPFFEDGPIAQVVEQTVAAGKTYVTAAGNQALAHYENSYFPGALRISGVTRQVHDFGIAAGGRSDVGQSILVRRNTSLTVVLQWNDPFASSANDYDLLIFDEGLTRILAISEETQEGKPEQFPIEFTTFENTQTTRRVNVVIRNLSADSRLLELHYSGENFTVEEFNMPGGSIVPGQQSAKGAIAVGAISVREPGADEIEVFSSRGPARIFFPREEVRLKPDLTAVDGNLITGAGGFGQQAARGSRFFGTSAAAPHAAAIAALLVAADPELSPADIRAALQSTAIDLGETGQDNTFGAGRIDALAAFVDAIETSDTTPTDFQLKQNYPNPFNPGTTIRYRLVQTVSSRNLRLEIFNALGQKVVTLDSPPSAGDHEVQWDGMDSAGRKMPSGIYFYRLRVGSSVQTKKMLLVH